MKNKSGFTLIELMISMTVLVMIIGVVLSIGMQSLKIYRNTYAYQSSQSDQMLALKKMEKDMREAYNIINTAGTYNNVSNVLASNGYQLSYTLPLKITGTYPPVNQFTESNNVLSTTEDKTKVIIYFIGDLYKLSSGSLVACSATDQISLSVGGKPNSAGKTLFRFELPNVTVTNGVYLYPTSHIARYAILPNLKSSTEVFSYASSADSSISWTNVGDATTRIIQITFRIPVLENTPGGYAANAEQKISTQFSIRNFSSF